MEFKTSLESCKRLLRYSELDPELYYNLVSDPNINELNPTASAHILTELDNYLQDISKPRKNIKHDLRVFYGLAKLTPKIVKKPSVLVMYENEYNTQNDKFVNQKMEVVYVRNQTIDEIIAGKFANRTFTRYEYFINEKPWSGDIEAIFFDNFMADENHVEKDQRNEIRDMLNKRIKTFYKNKLKTTYQGKLLF